MLWIFLKTLNIEYKNHKFQQRKIVYQCNLFENWNGWRPSENDIDIATPTIL